MSKKFFYSVLVIGWIVLGIAGCQSSTLEKTKKESASKEQYEPVVIQNYDREIKIEQKPTKVLTLGPNATELFIALGLEDYVIGNSLNNHSRGPLPEYEDEYNSIPELTYGSATRESVMTSGADFIYGIDWEFGEEGLDIDELATMGMTTYMNKAGTIEEIFKEIYDLGMIFDIEDKANAFVTDQKKKIEAVATKVEGQEVNVLVYDSGGNGVFTAGGTNFETLLIEQAGGKNVFSDITDKQWATVSYEEVLAREPDLILIHDYDSPSLEQKIEEIKQDPILSQLDSVKNERFAFITLESVLPGSRTAYAIESLAEAFYPELFK